MKKEYAKPIIELITIGKNDCITMSSPGEGDIPFWPEDGE